MATAHSAIEASGGAAIGIGTAAPYQARRLMNRSIPFELLLDPGRLMYDRLSVGRQSLMRYIFNVRAWLRWLRSFVVRGHGRVTGHYSILPAVTVVDTDATVRYLYRGRGLGDYPRLDDVLSHLEATTGNI